MSHRTAAVLFAAAATVLLSAPSPAQAASYAARSYPLQCRHSSKSATATVGHKSRTSPPTTGFTLDNPCSDWVMIIFLGAQPDAVFRFYAAPGTHLKWDANQVQQFHLKDGFNGNPLQFKEPRCAKQGRRELVAEKSGRVHDLKRCR